MLMFALKVFSTLRIFASDIVNLFTLPAEVNG